MGVLCTLTVEEGAVPGASTTYERKIRDLAARAELQKSMSMSKRELAERLADSAQRLAAKLSVPPHPAAAFQN